MQDDAEAWTDVAAVEDVPEGEAIGLIAGGKDLAIYRTEGSLYASDNRCTHGNARLCEGWLEGAEIECPLHQGRFDLKTGKALCAPLTEDIRVYPVKVEGGRISLRLD